MLGLENLPADRSVIQRMTSSLLHRGPDEEGIYISGPIGLGFRRLAILDLSSAAHQPMVSEDGDIVLVFNGEIYNYVELRRELQALGHTFKSTGDTEVLLRAYREWGPDCLPKLNGMWAFVIYDRPRGKFFGSRDRFGVKPLYCYRNKQYVLFASEIKAIRDSRVYTGGVNWNIASSFLLHQRLDESTECFYTGIEQVPPGSAFDLDLQGRWKQWRFWSLGEIPSVDINDPVQSFGELFEDSVRLRMRSDVPVGVCLSGGLDSTSILCAAARLKSHSGGGSADPLLAFSYICSEFDESNYIGDTLQQTGAEIKQLQTTPSELWGTLARVLWYHDEPVHSMTAVIGFKLMELAASSGTRVILNGQGADETLAGYFSYFADYWQMLVRARQLREAWREIGAFAAIHGGKRWLLFLNAMQQMLRWELRRGALYRELARLRQRRHDRNHPWFKPELVCHVVPAEFDGSSRTLNAILRRSVESSPLPLYLRIEDRNSMAHSVEARLPFLDYRLVALIANMRPKWKLQGPWNKFVLREAMRGHIPDSVRTRPDKMGFPTPIKKWFANDLYEAIRDLLTSREARERGIYNVREILKDLERHRIGQIDAAGKLFNVAQFEVWARTLPAEPPSLDKEAMSTSSFRSGLSINGVKCLGFTDSGVRRARPEGRRTPSSSGGTEERIGETRSPA